MSKKKRTSKAGKLTIKQKKFADTYIETGNATEAYKSAYATKNMKRNTIYAEGTRTLRKPLVQAYIDERMKEIDDAKTMKAKEAIEGLSSIARYEQQTNGEIPSIQDATKAMQEILKRHPLTDMSEAQIRKANAEARSAELDAEIKQAQLDSINQVADKAADRFENWSDDELKLLIGEANERIAENTNNQ